MIVTAKIDWSTRFQKKASNLSAPINPPPPLAS